MAGDSTDPPNFDQCWINTFGIPSMSALLVLFLHNYFKISTMLEWVPWLSSFFFPLCFAHSLLNHSNLLCYIFFRIIFIFGSSSETSIKVHPSIFFSFILILPSVGALRLETITRSGQDPSLVQGHFLIFILTLPLLCEPEVEGYNSNEPESKFGLTFSLVLILAITDINNHWLYI